MRGSLGEKIGEGAFSDVHVWAPGQVVKLFKAAVPQRLSRHEARVTSAVFATGAPAPEVLDEVTVEGGGRVPKHIATGILALIERARPEGGLCHADLHPGNVIMTADGPRLVDWTGAVRAPAAFDLACGHIILVEVAPEFIDDPQRPRAYNAAAQSEYARLAGMPPAALTAVMQTYLPIACVLNLLWGAGGALRERLIQRIEAALRPED